MPPPRSVGPGINTLVIFKILINLVVPVVLHTSMKANLERSLFPVFVEKVIETFTLGQELFLAPCQLSCTMFEKFVLIACT